MEEQFKTKKPAIFVSYSLEEKHLSKILKSVYPKQNIICAEDIILQGATITDKIKKLLDVSDSGIIIYTNKSSKSAFVNQEIGYLIAKEKNIIIFKENNTEMLTGFLYGKDYIPFDADKFPPTEMMEKSLQMTRDLFGDIDDNNIELVVQKAEDASSQTEVDKALVFGVVLLFGLILYALLKPKK